MKMLWARLTNRLFGTRWVLTNGRGLFEGCFRLTRVIETDHGLMAKRYMGCDLWTDPYFLKDIKWMPVFGSFDDVEKTQVR